MRPMYSWLITATLGKSVVHFCTGSYWLNIVNVRHKKLSKQDTTCPFCCSKLMTTGHPPKDRDALESDDESSSHIEDEHHPIFDCSGDVYAREDLQDLF